MSTTIVFPIWTPEDARQVAVDAAACTAERVSEPQGVTL